LGPIDYFAAMVNANEIHIEAQEHYTKQTYRNRSLIMTTSGVLPLTIPVIKVNGNHTKTKDVLISYSQKWQNLHWRAIVSAYNHSPYFLYYKEDLEGFFKNKTESLLDLNMHLTKLILDLIGCKTELIETKTYEKEVFDSILDLREAFHPKRKSQRQFKKYIQVFSEKFDFIPNLSILDLLFNVGPGTLDYLEDFSN